MDGTMISAALDAIRAGDVANLRRLVESDGALATARDENSVSLLMQACYHQQRPLIELLLAGDRPLDIFEAAALGRIECVRKLLAENAATPKARAPDGFTPLHLAAYFGQADVATLLIEAGADVDAVADNGSKLRPIHGAASRCDATIVKRLLAAGADVNAQQAGGYTALHTVAHRGDLELVEILLHRNADPSIRSDDGRTAREMAEADGYQGVATLLAGRE